MDFDLFGKVSAREPGRRAFLRSAVGLVAGSTVAASCSFERREAAREDQSVALTTTRPIVRARGSDAVWISSAAEELPVAYVSMETRRVFVDPGYYDRASWLLEAHISVSTALWRIPLPGDPPLTPISPGDEEREFEELPIGAWDPSIEPTEGDIRILRGRRQAARIEVGCTPVSGTTEWLSAGAFEIERCRVGSAGTVREDFQEVGAGLRHADRACVDGGREVKLLMWACRT